VHHHVDATELGFHLVEHGRDLLFFGDVGDIETDLRSQLRAFLRVIRDSPAGAAIAELIGQAQTDPELKAGYLERYSSPRRALAVAAMQKAKQRGKLAANLDAETVVDQLWGACYHRLLLPDQPLTSEFVDAFVDNLFGGIAA
jgi:Tetracyclin repressor-like, C-terminal domain